MKKIKIEDYYTKHKLNELIKTLRKNNPPTSEKNIKIAYQQFIEDFPGFSFFKWLDIYKKGETEEGMIKNITNALDGPKVRISNWGSDSSMGKGGRRGLAKEWHLYKLVMLLLFIPERYVKHFKLDIDPLDFLCLVKLSAMGRKLDTEHVSSETERIVNLTIRFLWSVVDDFLDEYKLVDLPNPSYQKAVRYFFGKDHPLALNIKAKGKQVSEHTLRSTVEKVLNHMSGRDDSKKGTNFYKEYKFYFLAWLASRIMRVLNLDFKAKVMIKVREIQELLDSSPDYERRAILQALIAKEFPSPLALPPIKTK